MGIKKINDSEELWRWLDKLGDNQSCSCSSALCRAMSIMLTLSWEKSVGDCEQNMALHHERVSRGVFTSATPA
jgi:hypothetical protein